MNIELIDGTFSREDAGEVIGEMILTKIKFHEKKISLSDEIEDIQFRERKIKKLSETLKNFREEIQKIDQVNIYSKLSIEQF